MSTTSVKQKRLAMYVTMALIGGVVFTVPSVTAADTDTTYALPDVVVTATRTEEPIDKVPANVTVLSGEDIQERHANNLGDALRIVPGVEFNVYGGGVGYTNSNGFRINGSNNVLFMVDGINMNAAGVNPPMTIMKNFDGIDRVEVVKGATSTLYGSGAIGGVVNVITRIPEEGMKTTVRAIGGSYGQEQYKIINEGKEENVYWRASYQKDLMGSYTDAHGLKVPQHLNAHTASFMVGSDIDENNNVMFSYDSYRGNAMYSDSNKKLNLIKHGTEANDSFRGIWKNKINDRLSHQLYILNNHYDTTFNNYKTEVHTKAIGDQVTYLAGEHTLIGGFDWRQDKVDSQSGVKLTNSSYFIQDSWNFAPKWTFIPGVRVDHHSTFGNHTSWHAALSHDLTEKTNVYLSYNEFFVAPLPSQLFGYYGNRNMKPETGHEIDLGAHHQFSDTLSGNLNFFVRRSSDKIGYDRTISKYANFDSEKARGMSVTLRKEITKNLSSSLGYTYTHIDATPQRAVNVDGYVPKHAVNFSLDYNDVKWDAHLDVRGVIDRPGPQTADVIDNFFPKTTYWITDISANCRVTDDITVFGRINNVFDVFYAEQSNARGNWYGESGEWWTMPGRNYQLGVEVSF